MNRFHVFALACPLFLAAPLALSQNPGPPSGGGPDGRPPRMERGPGGRGMGIVPPGTWWRNADTISSVGLSTDQQKRLDDIFLQSRTQLIQMHATLEEQQLQLEPLLASNPVDDNHVLAIISKIADTRAELEKADARMLLNLRKVLTPDQWTKLQAQRPPHNMMREHRNFNGQNPNGPPNPPPPGGAGDEL